MPIYENHTVLKPPKENLTLWRYMDIPSFLTLLAESALIFVRADLFEDKKEGYFTKPTAKQIDEHASLFRLNNGVKPHSHEIREIMNNVYINCWCIGEHELVHMWKTFSKENGIAIKTDYNTLNESIVDNELGVLPGIVNYVDRENDFVDWQMNIIQPYTIKGHEYKYENEFRLIIFTILEVEQAINNITNVIERNKKRFELYQKIPVIKCKLDILKLIKEIYISPYAPVWYENFLSDLLPRYGILDFQIKHSNL